jgi:hypothetical protein
MRVCTHCQARTSSGRKRLSVVGKRGARESKTGMCTDLHMHVCACIAKCAAAVGVHYYRGVVEAAAYVWTGVNHSDMNQLALPCLMSAMPCCAVPCR